MAVLPFPPLTLVDLQTTYSELLRCGADIRETNTVRKHVCQIKGGRLARWASPARVLALILSDVPGDDLSVVGSGPTCPDSTTAEAALGVFRRFRIVDNIPESVIALFSRGDVLQEPLRPTHPVFQNVQNVLVGSASQALEAAVSKALDLGYQPHAEKVAIVGEAREAGRRWGRMALELSRSRSLAPTVVVGAGETSVVVRGGGVGGRNQELALSAALEIDGSEDVAVCALATDGRDGPTDAAGAIVDGRTADWIRAAGVDPLEALRENDSYNALRLSGDLLLTGPTGTNVADIVIVGMMPAAPQGRRNGEQQNDSDLGSANERPGASAGRSMNRRGMAGDTIP